MTKEQMLATVTGLEDEGNQIIPMLVTEYTTLPIPQSGGLARFATWKAKCKNLVRLLGQSGESFEPVFNQEHNRVIQMKANVTAIKELIEGGLLISIESLVFAEAFSDLLEQAAHLVSGGYFLAAGVLGRAVLEEHLRKMCDRDNCKPSEAKPTLVHFKLALQKTSRLNKIELALVDAMAATGNDAAHNKPTLKQTDVDRLLPDVRRFLALHPIP